MKKLLINIGVSLLTTLIMLLVVELFMRVFIPQQLGPVQFSFEKEMGLIHIPNLEGRNLYPEVYDYTFSNDENGFRKTHKGVLPSFINKKVMLLGDSFTYGKGVSNNETFAWKMQERILQDSAQIINVGTEGRGTDRSLRAYQLYKDKFQPTTVIHFAHYNDIMDNYRDEYFAIVNDSTFTPKTFEHRLGGTKEKLQNSPIYNWLISHSHFFSLLKTVVVKQWYADQVITYEEVVDMKRGKEITGWYLNQLKKEVEQDGRKFIVYYIPAVNDLKKRIEEKSLTEQEAFFINHCKENNITFHNFSEELMNSGKEDIIKHFYLLEGHWNVNGHRLASEKLKQDANGFY